MNSKYVLNTGSATLHIVGYCHFTKHEKPEWKYFQTEEEAYNLSLIHILAVYYSVSPSPYNRIAVPCVVLYIGKHIDLSLIHILSRAEE